MNGVLVVRGKAGWEAGVETGIPLCKMVFPLFNANLSFS